MNFSKLDQGAIETALNTKRYGRSIVVLDSTESTNDDARKAALENAPDGHVVLADSQRRGRGAHGHAWASPANSDLYLSIVARPKLATRSLGFLTLAVGLGVADTVEHFLEVPAAIKWPNDVLLNGRKIAGILVESSSSGADISHAVIGVGLNVNRREWSGDYQLSPTSLALESHTENASLDRNLVFSTLLGFVESRVDSLCAGHLQLIREHLRTKLAWRNERVNVDSHTGILRDVADDGALVISTDAGDISVRSGSVRKVS